MDPTATLIGAIAAFLGALGFVLRAAQPYVTALFKSAADDRADLEKCEQDRRALERRVDLLEKAIRNDRQE